MRSRPVPLGGDAPDAREATLKQVLKQGTLRLDVARVARAIRVPEAWRSSLTPAAYHADDHSMADDRPIHISDRHGPVRYGT